MAAGTGTETARFRVGGPQIQDEFPTVKQPYVEAVEDRFAVENVVL